MDKLICIDLFNIDSYRYDTDICMLCDIYLYIIRLLSDGYN